MSPDEAREMVGSDERVVANYASGPGIGPMAHARGRIIGYADRPMVCILTDSGEKVWWMAHLTKLATTRPPTPHGEALRAGEVGK